MAEIQQISPNASVMFNVGCKLVSGALVLMLQLSSLFRSMSLLSPYFVGLDLRCGVWDLEDVHASNPTSPEMSFSVIHGLLGREVVWSARGDALFYSREYAISKRFTMDSGGSLLDLNEIANRSDSYVQQTFLDTPHECGRNLLPLGLQSASVSPVNLYSVFKEIVCSWK